MKNVDDLEKWVDGKDEVVKYAREILVNKCQAFGDSSICTRQAAVWEAADMIFDICGQNWDQVQYEEILEYMRLSTEMQKDTCLMN